MEYRVKYKSAAKYVAKEFPDSVAAYLFAIAKVKEDKRRNVTVYCKKKSRFIRCFIVNKKNYQMQTIRVGVIAAAGDSSGLDFFKMMYSN